MHPHRLRHSTVIFACLCCVFSLLFDYFEMTDDDDSDGNDKDNY